MSLIGLLVLIAVAAVILWGLSQMPLDATLMRIIRVVVIVVVAIAVIFFLANIFGFATPGLRIR